MALILLVVCLSKTFKSYRDSLPFCSRPQELEQWQAQVETNSGYGPVRENMDTTWPRISQGPAQHKDTQLFARLYPNAFPTHAPHVALRGIILPVSWPELEIPVTEPLPQPAVEEAVGAGLYPGIIKGMGTHH